MPRYVVLLQVVYFLPGVAVWIAERSEQGPTRSAGGGLYACMLQLNSTVSFTSGVVTLVPFL